MNIHININNNSNNNNIYKHKHKYIYKHNNKQQQQQVSFSSKPGLLYSKDDFYVLKQQNMVVMETTNGVMDKSLFKRVHPKTLQTWQRIPIANSLAQNGEDWCKIFKKHNSGI